VNLRRRLTLMSAVVVGVTLVVAAVVCFVIMRGTLRGQVDDQLRDQARLIEIHVIQLPDFGPRYALPAPPPRLGGSAAYYEVLDATGTVVFRRESDVMLAPTTGDRVVAGGESGPFLSDRHASGVHVRVLTQPLSGGGAVLLGRPLTQVDSVLSRLRLVLVALCVLGTALAAGASRLFSRPVIAPIRALTDAAEHIEATGDLAGRVQSAGDDEVGRMTARFNAMLDRLEASQAALAAAVASQRQLVADASHELRTPITSLRTNIEVLQEQGAGLSASERNALMADVVEQTEELGALVSDVIELARGEGRAEAPEDVRLDALAEEAVARAERHAAGLRFVCDLAPSVVHGAPERLARAINNLLHNAAKYSPPGASVEVRVAGGEVSVRDHGPGVPATELPHIFDRFYRGANAASHLGSGLGLAIVKQVAEAHGGTVRAEAAPGGGLRVRLRLPERPAGGLAPREPAAQPAPTS
jgi:two-component system, OmpR family, sensor histidine kinase MprB